MWSPSNPPRGIRKRENGNWVVERTVKGKRCPKTFKHDEWDQAIALWAADRAGIALPAPTNVAPLVADTWSLQQAYNFASETPKREGGFAGQKWSPDYHWQAVVRYFGEGLPIDQLRRDTDDERALRKKGRDELLARTLDGFVKALQAGKVQGCRAEYADASVDRVMGVLRKTIKLAAKKKRLAALPEFPAALSDGKHKIRYYSDDEEAGILAAPDRWFREAMTAYIDTGLRVSELQALARTEVDFKVGILLVHGRDAKGTKNGEFRSVPMTARVRAIMERRCANKGWESFDYSYGSLWRHFQDVKDGLGLTADNQFTMHTARHTCASRLVQRGVDLLVVKDWLGHKSIKTTLRYAHLRPKNLLDVVHVLEPAAEPQPDSLAAALAFLKAHPERIRELLPT